MIKRKPVGWRGHSLEHAIAASKPRKKKVPESFSVKVNCREENIGSNTDVFI